MATHGAFHWMQACAFVWLCLAAVAPRAASDTIKNYYDILHVSQTATKSQIKQSFRRLAVRYHPDKNKSADAETVFREIAEAYSVLSDKERRRLYDSVGHEAFLENEASVDPEHEHEHEHDTSFHFSFSDFFSDLDDMSFVEEPHLHSHFFEDEEVLFERHSFQGPEFSFYFEDIDDNEEEYL